MLYSFSYLDENERQNIVDNNKERWLIEDRMHFDGNYLIFTDIKPIELEVEELKKDKVSNQLALAELLEALITKGVL